MIPTPEAAAAEVARLDAEARQHKRAAAFHRSQARARREALRRFVDECRAYGIPVTVAIAGKAEAPDERSRTRT